ncbi:anthranilate phosphoribosyltransferase, partial [Gonapodya sp. JEL0774]
TSQSGSADTLESLGARLTSITPSHVPTLLRTTSFCFLFAQTFHPAMRHVAATRKEIGVRTVFNMLGPLTNPAGPRRVVVGVHSRELGGVMIEALKLSGVERGMVVCGEEGLDEISPEHPTFTWTLDSAGTITTSTITPSSFGLPTHPLSSMKGGPPAANAATMKRLLANEERGPLMDWVLMNAAAVLVVAGKAEGFVEGVEMARRSIESGAAKSVLERFVEGTQKAAAEAQGSS